MPLTRLCFCHTGSKTLRCPPDCEMGTIEAWPRDENGEVVPDSAFTEDELVLLRRRREQYIRELRLEGKVFRPPVTTSARARGK
jgi:hypothetical protein